MTKVSIISGFLGAGKTTFIKHLLSKVFAGQKVVLIDDLIAPGGTIEAAIKLVERLGGEVVKIVCLMELAGLEGRRKLEGYDFEAVVTYEGK